MQKIKGKYTEAVIYSDTAEDYAVAQVQMICDNEAAAGRLYSRSEVKNHHTVAEYKKAMAGIHCATVGAGTLDEAPFAYRGLDEIVSAIGDTVEITKVIKPIYNFKAKK